MNVRHDRILFYLLHIDQAAEEIVPAPHDAEQGDGCYGRLGAGHHDPQKDLKLVGAVNDRRFLQGLGNAPEEVHQQDDAEDGDRARKDQGPDGVEKMKIFYHDKGGDHASVKQHGKDQKVHVDISCPEFPLGPGHGIGHRNGEDQIQDQRKDHPDCGNPEGTPELTVFQDPPIGGEGKIDRKKSHPVGGYRGASTEGDRQDVQHRKQTEKSQEDRDAMNDGIPDF